MRYLHEHGSWADYKYVLIAWGVSFNSTLSIVNKKVILAMNEKNMGGWTSEWRGVRNEDWREHQLFQGNNNNEVSKDSGICMI